MRIAYLGRSLVAAVALVGVMSGCSNGDSADPTHPHATSTASPCPTPTSAAGLSVALVEWAINPAQSSVEAGRITFRASNSGAHKHELVITRGGDPAQLPRKDGLVDEGALPAGVLVGQIEGVAPGRTCEAAFTMTVGRYVLFCNLLHGTENHLSNGMVTVLTVT